MVAILKAINSSRMTNSANVNIAFQIPDVISFQKCNVLLISINFEQKFFY